MDVEVPGYRIQRELGHGGSARVYLALQHAFGRPVAVKVLSPALLGDPRSRQRFLREAEIAKGLDHPNIARVYDAGIAGDTPYLVMEYLRGGDLDRNLASGLHMQNVLRVVKDIAAALDYAHARGVVHRDVKPGNILFNEQGAALLSDFGVAALMNSETVKGTADRVSTTIPGTRPYMSPEQLAGEAVDGRSDLYSLGVVFYHMLTGRLPPAPSTAYLPDPPLPLPLAPLQDIVRRFLKALPDERFQSGAEIAAALDAVRTDGLVADAVVRTESVTTGEVEAAVGTQVRREERDSTPASTLGSRLLPATVLGSLLFIAVVAGVWYVATRPGGLERALAYAGLAEHPDVVDAWREAEALRLDPNQRLSVVVAAYRRVLVQDPRHAGALATVTMLAERWKDDAESALDAGDAGLAEAKLNDLATVFPADSRLPELFDRLNDLGHGRRLLADTRRLLARSGLSDARSVDAAILTYKEVLRVIPGNPEAQAALDDIAAHYGALAERDAKAQDVVEAMANFDRAVAASATFQGVDAVRATLSKAEELQAQIDALLQQAAELRETGALIDPPGANAAEIYRRVLATKPEDAIAVQGLAEIAAQVLANFDDLLASARLGDARGLLDRAAASGIGDELIGVMQARYDAELGRIEAVRRNVVEAENLLARNYITGPSSTDNAVARLREAQRLDPDNADVVRLLSVAATRLAKVAVEARDAGMTEDGLRYLDLALTVTPGISRWRELRERWQAEL